MGGGHRRKQFSNFSQEQAKSKQKILNKFPHLNFCFLPHNIFDFPSELYLADQEIDLHLCIPFCFAWNNLRFYLM